MPKQCIHSSPAINIEMNIRVDLRLQLHYQTFVDIDTVLQVIIMDVISIMFKKIKKFVLVEFYDIV